MGGKKAWQPQDWSDWSSSSYAPRQGAPWKLWPGAQPTASPRSKKHYDQMPLPSDASARKGKGKSGQPVLQEEGEDMMTDIQRAVTRARKADIRVRKLKEDRDRKKQQWKLWEKSHKEEYVKQKQRYEAALARIETEVQEATSQGQTAAREVQDIANGKKPTRELVDQEAENAWDAFIGTTEETAAPEAFLQDALSAAATAGHNPHGGIPGGRIMSPEVAAQLLQATLANLPPGFCLTSVPGAAMGQANAQEAGTGKPPLAEPTAAPPGLSTQQVPFPPSPSTSHPEMGVGYAAASPGTRGKTTPRQPVKGATLHPVHTGPGPGDKLASKLEAKRQAMQPFGIPSSAPAGLAGRTPAPTQSVGSDEDMPSEEKHDHQTGVTPVGLDGMG
ncbi:unnamed protein product [Symbiodinium sp. CCMP2592]|nr:unnamed protein product [Symbiodinium sp. CCMP2592]